MPLIIAVGVTSAVREFVVALSFVKLEHSDDFKFIFDCLGILVWVDCVKGAKLCGLAGARAGGRVRWRTARCSSSGRVYG